MKLRIYKRKGSRFWQAEAREGGKSLRRSTHCIIPSAAEAFAELLAAHMHRLHAPPPRWWGRLFSWS